MDAVMIDHHSIPSNNKQVRIPKKNTRAFITKRSENLSPMNIIHGSLLYATPSSLSFSYPPSSSLLPLQYLQQIQQLKNPPLLPLPIPRIHHQFVPSLTRGFSCPPTTRKSNRVRDHFLTPKKPKSKSPNCKIEEPRQVTQSLMIYSKNPLGPHPNDLPKGIPKVLLSLQNRAVVSEVGGELGKFTGSVFSLSPHPSKLPLPKFSMRPKLSCNTETAGIDAGATDNLRRMLRLH